MLLTFYANQNTDVMVVAGVAANCSEISNETKKRKDLYLDECVYVGAFLICDCHSHERLNSVKFISMIFLLML